MTGSTTPALSDEEQVMLDEYAAEQGYHPDDPDLFAGKEAS